jgi:hypothetical protein
MSFSIKGARIFFFGILYAMISILFVYTDMLYEKKFALKLSGGIKRLSGSDFDANDEAWSHLRMISAEDTGGTLTS